MSEAAPLVTLLSILGRDGERIRFGVGLGDTFRTVLALPTEIEKIVAAANRDNANLWYEINPSAYDQTAGRSSAGHVSRLNALYVDIDYKAKPGGMGSKPEAEDLIQDLVGALGVFPSAIVHSGHGQQAYWPIEDARITAENRNEIASMLKRWGILVKQMAGAHYGGADNVYDLPRILRVPGTTNWKDPDEPVAVTLELPSAPQPSLTCAEIIQVLDDHGILEQDVEIGVGVISPVGAWEWADRDCDFVAVAMKEIDESFPNGRHPWSLKYASLLHGMIRYGCVTEATFYDLRQHLIDRLTWLCQNTEPKRAIGQYEVKQVMRWAQHTAEGWTDGKLDDEMRQHIHIDEVNQQAPQPDPYRSVTPSNVTSIYTGQPVQLTGPVTDGALALDTEIKVQQRLGLAAYTDVGNAERLAQQLRGRYIWVPSIGWHYWDGARWALDADSGITEQAKDLFIHMIQTSDSPAVSKWASTSLSRSRIAAAIELCKSIPYLIVPAEGLDAAQFEMCTPGGVVDLRSSQIRPGNPLRDHHTLQAAYTPDPTMPIPQFLKFLTWAMGGDDQKVRYLQRLFGAAAIGKVMWHIFPIFLGVGSNGKTTVLDLMGAVFGQYATVMPDRFLIERRGEPHPTEIAQLRGVRLAMLSEIPPHATFDEALMKRLTGETRLRARYMNKNFFEFENTTTFFLAANHLPGVAVGGRGFWRRIRKIDFPNALQPHEEDGGLVQRILAAEGPGILAWVVAGAQQALTTGLDDPASVIASTREYQLEEDAMARFIEAHIIDDEHGLVDREHLYNIYKPWMFRQGLEPESMTKFSRAFIQARPMAGTSTRSMFAWTALKATYVYATDPRDGE